MEGSIAQTTMPFLDSPGRVYFLAVHAALLAVGVYVFGKKLLGEEKNSQTFKSDSSQTTEFLAGEQRLLPDSNVALDLDQDFVNPYLSWSYPQDGSSIRLLLDCWMKSVESEVNIHWQKLRPSQMGLGRSTWTFCRNQEFPFTVHHVKYCSKSDHELILKITLHSDSLKLLLASSAGQGVASAHSMRITSLQLEGMLCLQTVADTQQVATVLKVSGNNYLDRITVVHDGVGSGQDYTNGVAAALKAVLGKTTTLTISEVVSPKSAPNYSSNVSAIQRPSRSSRSSSSSSVGTTPLRTSPRSTDIDSVLGTLSTLENTTDTVPVGSPILSSPPPPSNGSLGISATANLEVRQVPAINVEAPAAVLARGNSACAEHLSPSSPDSLKSVSFLLPQAGEVVESVQASSSVMTRSPTADINLLQMEQVERDQPARDVAYLEHDRSGDLKKPENSLDESVFSKFRVSGPDGKSARSGVIPRAVMDSSEEELSVEPVASTLASNGVASRAYLSKDDIALHSSARDAQLPTGSMRHSFHNGKKPASSIGNLRMNEEKPNYSSASSQISLTSPSQGKASVLVVETEESGVKRYYRIPPVMAKKGTYHRKGLKLHVYNDHLFVAVHFSGNARLCGACSLPIRGIGKQGYSCRDCAVAVHKRCHTMISSWCPSSSLSTLNIEYLGSTDV